MPPKKKSIPKVLKDLVWDKNIGKEKGIGECYVCNQEIDSKRFHCGHIISEKNGGETQLDNLKPICATCNLSIGTQHMDEFKKTFFSEKKKDKPECYFKMLHEYMTLRQIDFTKQQIGGITNLSHQRHCNNTIFYKFAKQNYKEYDINNLLERSKPKALDTLGKVLTNEPCQMSLTCDVYNCIKLAKDKEYICEDCIKFVNLLS